MKRGSSAGVVAVLLLCAQPAKANDTSLGGTAVDLVSRQESSVKMSSERITIRARGQNWEVEADYRFFNSSPQPLHLQVGFPEVRCPQQQEADCHATAFLDLQTQVNGQRVAHSKGSLAETEDWSEYLGTFWLFEADFPAQQETRIQHHYSMDQTLNVMGQRWLTYVTRTGATWADTIGKASFRLLLPPNTIEVFANDSLQPQGMPQLKIDEEKAYYELVFERDDWQPEGDFSFGFSTSTGAYELPRFTEKQLRERALQLGLDPEHLCPGRPDAQDGPLSPEQAQMCKNMIYAAWGYPFKKKELAELFYGGASAWEHQSSFEDWSARRDPQAQPAFDISWLSPGELQLLKALDELGGKKHDMPARQDAPPSSQVNAEGATQGAPSNRQPHRLQGSLLEDSAASDGGAQVAANENGGFSLKVILGGLFALLLSSAGAFFLMRRASRRRRASRSASESQESSSQS